MEYSLGGMDDLSSLGEDYTMSNAKDLRQASIASELGADDEDGIVDLKVSISVEKKELEDEEVDDEEIDREKNCVEEIQFLVEGLFLHDAFRGMISPTEFEEIVYMFKTLDVSRNGLIDKFEARKILFNLDMDASLSNAEALLSITILSGAKEMNFDEFCRFFVMIKNGDPRVMPFARLLDFLHESILGRLEHQATMRNMTITFYQVINDRMIGRPQHMHNVFAEVSSIKITLFSLQSILFWDAGLI